MTNAEREEYGRLHWMPAVRLWAMGYSAQMISEVMGFKNVRSFTTRKNQLRHKHPEWFPARVGNFVPVDRR